ncbi:hypothetical protein EDD22DRAFT_389598 [Suillus occidentalis]|nr:hypothetical protein EDD22DRAFT_389598 [Suillus occidentalis]
MLSVKFEATIIAAASFLAVSSSMACLSESDDTGHLGGSRWTRFGTACGLVLALLQVLVDALAVLLTLQQQMLSGVHSPLCQRLGGGQVTLSLCLTRGVQVVSTVVVL